ncbi:ureide permease 1-like protein, partial [Tanacetum coccineum]
MALDTNCRIYAIFDIWEERTRERKWKEGCTTLNYFLDDRINRAKIPFPGVACFLIVVCFGSLFHTSNAKDNQEKLDRLEDPHTSGKGLISNTSNTVSRNDMEYGNNNVDKANAGTANFLVELESRRAIKVMNGLQFMGGQAAGYTAADAVQ